MRHLAPLLCVLAACGESHLDEVDLKSGGGEMSVVLDMTSTTPGDAGLPDFAGGCKPDPMTDGQMCSTGCPAGTEATVDSQGTCRCYTKCTPNSTGECVCGRACRSLYYPTDGGLMPTGTAACVPANGAAERCGADPKGGASFGSCGENLICVTELNQTTPDYAYCMYICTSNTASCPRGTSCLKLSGGTDSVCVINSGKGGKATGSMCTFMEDCDLANACDGTTCRTQCNGPKDTTTCTGGTKCTPLIDPNNGRISAYVCK